jgi:hypothetical protein
MNTCPRYLAETTKRVLHVPNLGSLRSANSAVDALLTPGAPGRVPRNCGKMS